MYLSFVCFALFLLIAAALTKFSQTYIISITNTKNCAGYLDMCQVGLWHVKKVEL